MDTLNVPADLDNLHTFQSFILEKGKEMGVPAELTPRLELVMEELAVNVISYAYPNTQGEIEIHCKLEQHEGRQRFCVQLRDWGVAFDPLSREIEEMNLDVAERPIGGLGILFAGEMTDSLTYKRENDSNVLVFCFDFP